MRLTGEFLVAPSFCGKKNGMVDYFYNQPCHLDLVVRQIVAFTCGF